MCQALLLVSGTKPIFWEENSPVALILGQTLQASNKRGGDCGLYMCA